jgi:PHD/YefM family antitoxin component YafN of YafNO toxin-antitoxin module
VKTTDLTITELSKYAPRAVADTEKAGVRAILKHGRAVAFLVSRQVMESILETMELQQNPELMKQVRQHKAGKLKFHKVTDED